MGMLVKPDPSSDRARAAGCASKVRYTSRKKAVDALRALHASSHGEARHRDFLRGLNVYECQLHGCWHIGHKSKGRA